jgi:hypothetical protein
VILAPAAVPISTALTRPQLSIDCNPIVSTVFLFSRDIALSLVFLNFFPSLSCFVVVCPVNLCYDKGDKKTLPKNKGCFCVAHLQHVFTTYIMGDL